MTRTRLAIAMLVFVAPVLFAQTTAKDPVLDAMKAELERSKAKLVLNGMQRPYFIEYRL